MELTKTEFERVAKLGVLLLPCPFENDSYTVIDKDGSRKGRIKPTKEGWVAIFMKETKGTKKKIDEAVKLLL